MWFRRVCAVDIGDAEDEADGDSRVHWIRGRDALGVPPLEGSPVMYYFRGLATQPISGRMCTHALDEPCAVKGSGLMINIPSATAQLRVNLDYILERLASVIQ
jgi:hypothetical protein